MPQNRFCLSFYFSPIHSFSLSIPLLVSHNIIIIIVGINVFLATNTNSPKLSKICFLHGPISTYSYAYSCKYEISIQSIVAVPIFGLHYFYSNIAMANAFWKCHRVCHLLNEKPKCRQHLLLRSSFIAVYKTRNTRIPV